MSISSIHLSIVKCNQMCKKFALMYVDEIEIKFCISQSNMSLLLFSVDGTQSKIMLFFLKRKFSITTACYVLHDCVLTTMLYITLKINIK